MAGAEFLDAAGDAAVVTIPHPTGAMQALLLAHDIVIVRPDRIVSGVASTSHADALAARLRSHLADGGATAARPAKAPGAAIPVVTPGPARRARTR